jgi:G:T-mismatch repair DNA endonuclease (very short patch repair protein)
MIDAKHNLAKLNSRYASKNGEMCIELPFDNNTKCFMLDFVLFNKVIEFNGDYYHANPHLYKSDDFIQKYSNGKYAKEIWNYDEKRLTAIKNAGYEVKVIWESDYYANPEKILEECVEFLARK